MNDCVSSSRVLIGGRKKGAVSCLYRTDDRTGHCKFRLDCRIKKKAKDWPLSTTSAHNVSVFPVSILPEDLPSKKTWHLAMMMAWMHFGSFPRKKALTHVFFQDFKFFDILEV
ncbi:hypothetical protein EMCRGX_G023340 [Ephydatia muelleri]